jgi:hypothetical protein
MTIVLPATLAAIVVFLVAIAPLTTAVSTINTAINTGNAVVTTDQKIAADIKARIAKRKAHQKAKAAAP